MDRTADTHMTTQLQQVTRDERLSNFERKLLIAAEARHRLRLLSGDKPRLEDSAEEWIELLHAGMQESADHDTTQYPADTAMNR